MWLRMRFDIGWSDVLFGLRRMGTRRDRVDLQERICDLWPRPERMFPCLSVRSGFDMLWKSLDLPAGSEVIMSALTIPDMVRIVEHHKLLPVPVDLNVSDMAPDPEQLRRAITPKTKAIVVAHLFGTRIPLEPIIQVAREHNLLVIEDCAQAFVGCHDDGHPDADVTMFSFGPIKTITAFGGGVFCVRDAKLLARMQAIQSEYPVQSRWSFFKRFSKYSFLKVLSCRPLRDAILTVYRAAGFDYDRWISTIVRAFPGPKWLERLQYQPSAPLLAMLEHRLSTFDDTWLAAREARGNRLARLLPVGAMRPAASVADHTYWVFPILANNPPKVVEALADLGYDATQLSSLRVIDPPEDRPELDPAVARDVLAHMIFLPLCPEMPRRELERMARILGGLTEHLTMDPDAIRSPAVFPRVLGDSRSG
jgi:dTDP-4-amino-4,6-dideoxygalactose transaminase